MLVILLILIIVIVLLISIDKVSSRYTTRWRKAESSRRSNPEQVFTASTTEALSMLSGDR